MQIFHNQIQIRAFIRESAIKGMTIGLVPTMGALHEGHLSLIHECRSQTDLTITSIFVNPLQFNNVDDYKKYPQVLDDDIKLLKNAGCDVLFLPTVNDLYATNPLLKMDFGYLDSIMEGRHRPGHFNGVGIVVSKLFNIIQPHKAFFGQKDLQQCAIIKCLTRDLSYPIDIHVVQTLREPDGLAMSSRNRRLSLVGRKQASEIYLSLQDASSNKHLEVVQIKNNLQKFFSSRSHFKLEYFEICDPQTLEIFDSGQISGNAAFCIAAFLEDVRLIDNVIV